MAKSILLLSKNDVTIGTVSFDIFGATLPEAISVSETDIYNFTVESKEPGVEYALWTGDISLSEGKSPNSLEQTISVGRNRRTEACWDDGKYFDGARGRVLLRLASRFLSDEKSVWTERFELPIYVIPSKLTENSFRTMSEELRRIASGLLLDLISKSRGGVDVVFETNTPVRPSSSQQELVLLSKLWSKLSAALEEVFSEPWRTLSRVTALRQSYGCEKFDSRATAALASRGIDPRRSTTPKPFFALQTVLRENADTLEHQIIAGFLQFLLERVNECLENIKRHKRALEDERKFRVLSSSAGVSLYESEDVPKLEKLEIASHKAYVLTEQIRLALKTDCMRCVTPRFAHPDSPVFRNVESYYRVRTLIQSYLSSSLVILDEGYDERLKSNSRLYEQWVFIQIVAALREVGLSCVSRNGMLNRVRKYRYTLDIDRGASLTFTAGDGWYVVVRYEPWVLTRAAARQQLDTVYAELRGNEWSPDILVEVFADSGQEKTQSIPSAEFAFVVDAKYAKGITPDHWRNVDKYLKIRSTVTGEQIVRQVWIAAPCSDIRGDIWLDDISVHWTENGPDRDRSEQIRGIVSLIPDTTASAEESGWLVEPSDVAVQFVRGMLNYVGVPCIAKHA